jgi:hypothetical protein
MMFSQQAVKVQRFTNSNLYDSVACEERNKEQPYATT